jgi:hypothetical protein
MYSLVDIHLPVPFGVYEIKCVKFTTVTEIALPEEFGIMN